MENFRRDHNRFQKRPLCPVIPGSAKRPSRHSQVPRTKVHTRPGVEKIVDVRGTRALARRSLIRLLRRCCASRGPSPPARKAPPPPGRGGVRASDRKRLIALAAISNPEQWRQAAAAGAAFPAGVVPGATEHSSVAGLGSGRTLWTLTVATNLTCRASRTP